MNARDIVIEEARRAGVDPAIALSVWQQESGGSTDLGLRGQTIERGKWKGHYARGPWQIMSFHGDIPNDFRGQTAWAMQHLKERGVRGYYGEGTPGVAGHPSTNQYEQQVLARAGRMPDTRMASTNYDPGSTDTQHWPTGDPATGAMDMAPISTGSDPQLHPLMEQIMSQYQQQQEAARAEAQPDLADMMLAMGSGILTAGNRNAFGAGFENLQRMLHNKQTLAASQSPREMSMLEQLRASSELYKLEDARNTRRIERAAETRRRASMQRIVENLRAQGKHAEADALEAELLTPQGAQDALGIGGGQAADVQVIDGVPYIVNPDGSVTPSPGYQAPPSAGPKPTDAASMGNTLRDDYRTDTQAAQTALDRYMQVRDYAPEQMTGAEDYALLTSLGKLLDPASAFQQGEAETLQSMASGQGQFAAAARAILSGGSLKPKEREQILNEMERRAAEIQRGLVDTYGLYARRSAQFGLDPMQVLPQYPPAWAPRAGRPRVVETTPPGSTPGAQTINGLEVEELPQ